MDLIGTDVARRVNVKPITFNTEMTKALLAGNKTQTRLVITPRKRKIAKQREHRQGDGLWVHGYNEEHIAKREAYGSIKDYSVSPMWIELDAYIKKYAPCKPGDILWVRETWGIDISRGEQRFVYKTSGVIPYLCKKWNPPYRMPKEAARIFLRVVDVKVERLQDITPEDCRAEGLTATAYANFEIPDRIVARNSKLKHFPMDRLVGNETGIISDDSPWWRIWYKILWNSLHVKHGYPWESNPWVWKIEFEKIEKP